jgi:hypothetical protein
MFTSNAIRFVLFFFLSLSANAETVRGAQRELESPPIESAVILGIAGEYAILAKSGISTVPSSKITGDIAVSPIAATAMTGFSLTLDSTAQFSTSVQVVGQAHAASFGGAVATKLTTAVSNMEAAYTDAAGRLNPTAARINPEGGVLGVVAGTSASPLTPGVYTFDGNVLLSNDIYFEGTNTETDIFIIQMAGNLLQNPNLRVHLTNGALAKNIFWQVAGNVKVMAGSHMEGILLVKTDVLFMTGSSLNGRVLAQTACNPPFESVYTLISSRLLCKRPHLADFPRELMRRRSDGGQCLCIY